MKEESVLKATDSRTCYFCKKPGHMKADCRKFQTWKERNENFKRDGERANVADEKDNTGNKECLFTLSTLCMDGWIVDSGATSHLTGNRKNFISMDETYRSIVDLADGNKVNVLGRGVCAVKCMTSSGSVMTAQITDVLYTPQVNGSLLSVSKLAHKGYTVKFTNKTCELMRGNEQIAVLDEMDNLYKLRQPEIICAIKSAAHEGCVHQWHRIFGHRDTGAIKEMFKNNMIEGAKLVECSCQDACEICLRAKSTRLPFPKESMNRSRAVLELMYTDICGPMQTISKGGRRYILTLIDDYSM